MFDAICALSPDDLVRKPSFAKAEQVKTVLSGIIGSYFSLFAISLNGIPDDDITGMFFKGRVLKKSKKFEKQEVPENIALWLSRFHIARKDFVPLVKVDETNDGFVMELLVEDRTAELSEPIPLKIILTLKKYAKKKYDILKDVTLLADYLPEIADFLASGGETRPEFSPTDFEAVLFRHLPTLKLLNIPSCCPRGWVIWCARKSAQGCANRSPKRPGAIYRSMTCSNSNGRWRSAIKCSRRRNLKSWSAAVRASSS